MQLYIASDHAGFEHKSRLVREFREHNGKKIEWIDLGATSTDATDYPNNARALVQRVLKEKTAEQRLEPCGVLICGSGVGVNITANRHKGIRAVLAFEEAIAAASRQHNASNVICFGQRFITYEKMCSVLKAWLDAPYEGRNVERHERRVQLMDSDS